MLGKPCASPRAGTFATTAEQAVAKVGQAGLGSNARQPGVDLCPPALILDSDLGF